MDNLLEDLKKILQKDERLVSGSELLKNKIIELALKLDKDLIKLLLSDEKMKEVFFVDVDGMLIFDKDKFIKFVSNKQFLPDSYTAFKNKIGLIDEKGEFISEKKEVVLSWPYKDCVLEGGMTKEDQKRDEIFWNEILAPDQITRLLDPKVFTNAKRIDKDGEHKFDGFITDANGDIKDNLIIKGNNLLVLHSLKKRFAGKVKLIYIDPPYNTGGSQETFTYNNAFNHSTWMTFMKNRLEVAKNLLRQDGFIAITIDHNELFYLGTLADEIFDRNNRVGIVTIVVKPEGRQFSKFFAVSNEYLLVYARDIRQANFEKVILDPKELENFNRIDEKGRYRLRRYINYNKPEISSREVNPQGWYPFYVSKDLKIVSLERKEDFIEIWPIDKGIEKSWQTNKETALERIKEGEIVCEKNKKGEPEIFLKVRPMQRYVTHWTDSRYNSTHYGTRLLTKILGREPEFSYPKSLYSTLDTIKITTSKKDIILDFFAGSGTTAHAVLELNKEDGGDRRFIMVEQLDEHVAVCKERIQKVLQKENINDSFVYLELMKWNENFVEKILSAKTKDELKKLWETMKEKAFLSYKVDIKTIDEHAKDFDDLSIEDQKRFLLECLDKNHLYVNYSEIDDEEYGISEEDKKLNREFYNF
jgi:adenine-specific DNA-methyltransferase